MDATTLWDAGFKTQVDDLIDRYSPHGRERVWGRKTLFWSMVGQALEFNASCAFAVKTLQATGRKCSASTAAFCKARAKFPDDLLDLLLDFTAQFPTPDPRFWTAPSTRPA